MWGGTTRFEREKGEDRTIYRIAWDRESTKDPRRQWAVVSTTPATTWCHRRGHDTSCVRRTCMTTHRLLRYLCTLPAAQIQDVLRHEGCGQAVFRLLPSVAKHLVLRTAFVDVPIPRGASKMGNKSVHAMRRKEKADLDETNRRGDGVDGRNGPRDDGRRLGTAGGTAGEDGKRVERTWMEDADLVLTSCGYSSSKKRGWNQEA